MICRSGLKLSSIPLCKLNYYLLECTCTKCTCIHDIVFHFYACSTPGGVVQAPSKKVIERLWGDIKRWEDIINEEAENFTGDVLIGHQEEIKNLVSLVERWTEVSMQLFTRHQLAEDAEKSSENERMTALNSAIEIYLAQCGVRVAGENGESAYVHVHV